VYNIAFTPTGVGPKTSTFLKSHYRYLKCEVLAELLYQAVSEGFQVTNYLNEPSPSCNGKV